MPVPHLPRCSWELVSALQAGPVLRAALMGANCCPPALQLRRTGIQRRLVPVPASAPAQWGYLTRRMMMLSKQKGAREPVWMVSRVCVACFGINPAHAVVAVTTLRLCAVLLCFRWCCLQVSVFGLALALKTPQGTKHALFQTLPLPHGQQQSVLRSKPCR